MQRVAPEAPFDAGVKLFRMWFKSRLMMLIAKKNSLKLKI